jgi:peptidoglycan/LPS O-acetylase OafA/YrhL
MGEVPALQPQATRARPAHIDAPAVLPAKSGHLPELDGLRGLAALCAVAFHYLSGPAARFPSVAAFKLALEASPFALDTFFVLSGFLIGGILLRTRESPHYVSTFYLRRAFRILPLYYSWIAFYLLLLFLMPGGWGLQTPPGHSRLFVAASYLFLFQNYFVSIVGISVIAVPTWTLAVEEHFYLLAPPLVRWLDERRLVLALCGIIALAMVARGAVIWFADPSWSAEGANCWTICRADALALGVILAVVWRSEESRRWISAYWRTFALAIPLLTLVGYALLSSTGGGRADEALRTVFARTTMELCCLCLMLLVLARPASRLCDFLRSGTMRELGRISYCLYLVHWGVLWTLMRFVFHTRFGVSMSKDAAATALGVVLSIAIAKLSWRFLETPLLNRAHARYKY